MKFKERAAFVFNRNTIKAFALNLYLPMLGIQFPDRVK